MPGKEDNLLLEMETALWLRQRRRIQIYPVLLGQRHAPEAYGPYDFANFGGHRFPAEPSATQLHGWNATLSQRLKLAEVGTIQATMTKLLSLQGDTTLGNGPVDIGALAGKLMEYLHGKAWALRAGDSMPFKGTFVHKLPAAFPSSPEDPLAESLLGSFAGDLAYYRHTNDDDDDPNA